MYKINFVSFVMLSAFITLPVKGEKDKIILYLNSSADSVGLGEAQHIQVPLILIEKFDKLRAAEKALDLNQYVEGFLSQISQKVTSNFIHNFKNRRDKSYKMGAEEANFWGDSFEALRLLGFVECEFWAVYNENSYITINEDYDDWFVYKSKTDDKKLLKLMSDEKSFDVRIKVRGWLSPKARYFPGGASRSHKRVFVLKEFNR